MNAVCYEVKEVCDLDPRIHEICKCCYEEPASKVAIVGEDKDAYGSDYDVCASCAKRDSLLIDLHAEKMDEIRRVS